MTLKLNSRWLCVALAVPVAARCQTMPNPMDGAAQKPTEGAPGATIERSGALQQRIPQQRVSTTGVLQGMIVDEGGRPVPGVQVRLVPSGSSVVIPPATTSGDGIFRMLKLPPGKFDLILTRTEGPPSGVVWKPEVEVHAGEVLSVEIRLPQLPDKFVPALPQSQIELSGTSYHELSRRPDSEGAIVVQKEVPLAPEDQVYRTERDRWNQVPFPNDYRRYGGHAETPYIMGHWFDPFNRNVLKADKPFHGKTFFEYTGVAITAMDGRRLPVPAGQSTERPVSPVFFGRGGQYFIAETFRMTFDMFHGDTSAFRPVDWRIRVTPAINTNYIIARENQAVSPDVRVGTTRFDEHIGLQEAFGEVKLHDVGQDYDFVNLRAGIQQFVSDFRGFIFAEEQPGVRIFGNLRSNRYQYNLAAFDLLEKDTNSGLNTFERRGRQVAIGNFFMQDFLTKGYTAQVSYHFARDNGTTHYDRNGFLVRPSPIGNVIPHRVDAHYIGLTGDGHIGKYNITNAFYQVLGDETLNQIANKYTKINAQLAAVELSKDHDYVRVRTSFFYASGDNKPRSQTARGFSSIVDGVSFAGGEFSFFNREGIPLTRAGVALTAPSSFLPDLRSSKDEGQSNFKNPGLFLYNVGADLDLTQKIKLVGNFNYLQFARTQTLIFLLQQNAVRRTIGYDSGVGVIYRPFLSDNIVIHAGATALVPGAGLRDIYTSQTLISVFGLVKFQF